MKIVMLTDTHFGIKSGSMGWFRAQRDFIYKQFIPYLQGLKNDDESVIIIHLGDVFDSRSSIPTIIAHEVHDMFDTISSIYPIYIIQGNHDGASPVDRKYNTNQLILRDIKNVRLVNETTLLDIDGLDKQIVLLPWFDQEPMSPTEYTEKYKGHHIFTHSDIIMGNPKLYTNVFSGHVHKPYINGKVRNLGSCFATDFHDANQDRYFYEWIPETDELRKFKNEHAIRFWRIYDEDVLTRDWSKIKDHDYIEVYIKYALFQDNEYQSKCDWIRKHFKNSWIIPVPDELATDTVDVGCDITDIIEHSIPDDLRERFEIIKAKINNGNTER